MLFLLQRSQFMGSALPDAKGSPPDLTLLFVGYDAEIIHSRKWIEP